MNMIVWMILAMVVAAIVQRTITTQKVPTGLWRNAPLIAAIITVNIMSILDAISTIYLVTHNHSSELNPVMNALIEHSYLLFFGVKLGLTLIATLVCWHYYEHKRKARMILRLTSNVYCALMFWHCLLLSSVLV